MGSAAGSPRIVTVGTTATKLSDAGTRIRARLFRNLSGVTIYLGAADVTASTVSGWAVAAGEDFPDSISSGTIYGIVAAATADMQVWEVD